ncbi:ATP-binding cassette domain-containing protein [Microbacterium sp. 18062]|uniref:ATP-binding cassette domain-containing protein n=1 Tax=Microbacterium sp. 18062 TaxID=2681410 RepID=UPI00135942B7
MYELGAGESLGIVGETGSGKSTIARILLGSDTADAGRITFGGLDLSAYRALRPRERREARRRVQMVFQDPYSSLNPARTVGGVLTEVLHIAGRDERTDGVAEILSQVGLPVEYATRLPSDLSGDILDHPRSRDGQADDRDAHLLARGEIVEAVRETRGDADPVREPFTGSDAGVSRWAAMSAGSVGSRRHVPVEPWFDAREEVGQCRAAHGRDTFRTRRRRGSPRGPGRPGGMWARTRDRRSLAASG